MGGRDMKATLSGFLVFVCLFVCGTLPAEARFAYPDAVSYVHLSGELLPLEGEAQPQKPILIVLINGQPWRFVIENFEQVRDHDQEEIGIPTLLRSAVRVYGAETLIDSLKKPDVVGQPITIQGYLYPQQRRLLAVSISGLSPLAQPAAYK